MSGLIARVLPAEGAPAEAAIAVDGWFPPIDPAALRDVFRIPVESVSPARLRELVLAAVVTVTNDLADWASARRTAGAASMDAITDVANPAIGGEPRLSILWRRAIGSTVKADIVERYRDTAVPGTGHRRADEQEPSVEELRRDAIWAIRDILGCSRTCVELI